MISFCRASSALTDTTAADSTETPEATDDTVSAGFNTTENPIPDTTEEPSVFSLSR